MRQQKILHQSLTQNEEREVTTSATSSLSVLPKEGNKDKKGLVKIIVQRHKPTKKKRLIPNCSIIDYFPSLYSLPPYK